MPDLYNTSWMDNATNPVEIITGIGSSVGNDYLIGTLLVFGFWFVFVAIGTMKHDFLEVLAVGSFITTIISILLAYVSIVSFVIVVFPAIVFFIALISMFINR